MKFSEKRTLDKRKKFEKELRSELSKWESEHLKNATAIVASHTALTFFLKKVRTN